MVFRLFPYKKPEFKPLPEIERCVSYDDTGAEVITYVEVPINRDLGFGSAEDWTLDAMMKAGINPSTMNIHTSSPTRGEVASEVAQFAAFAEDILSTTNTEE